MEGDSEYHALPLLTKMVEGCPPIRAANCCGIGGEVSAKGAAKRTFDHIRRHLAAGRDRVIVCIDRELRSQCAGSFAQEVLAELDGLLQQAGHGKHKVSVVVANRAFEAWILADAEGLHRRGALRKLPKFTCFEGERGKRDRLGKQELTDLLGSEYSETRDGPKLFSKLDVSVARHHGPGLRGSRSFDKLLRELGV